LIVKNIQGETLSKCGKRLQNCVVQVTELNSCQPQPGFITITNNSNIIARNISASSSDSNFTTFVIQNNTCPSALAPGASCTISFYTNTDVSFAATVLVKGTNTNTTFFTLNAYICQTTLSLVTPTTPQILAVDGVSTIAFTVANTGSGIADNVTMTSPWTGVTFTPSSCGMIPVGGTCNFTIQTSTPNLAKQVTIQGTNTNTLTSPYVAFTLDGYLIFSATGGIAKVLFTTDIPNTNPGTMPWDSNLACKNFGICAKTLAVSTTDGFYLLPSGGTDPSGNTFLIISGPNAIGTQGGTGGNAAANCYNITNDNTGAVPNGTWYLPALCELGPCTPDEDNVNENLFINSSINFPAFVLSQQYWSSGEQPVPPPVGTVPVANTIVFGVPPTVALFAKSNTSTVTQTRVRCARTINY
jgi:hypothetical protein